MNIIHREHLKLIGVKYYTNKNFYIVVITKKYVNVKCNEKECKF
jgi:hypothetical protein